MFKKFIFILFVFIFIFSFIGVGYASDGGVAGLTYDIPESPDYPNHTYIFVFSLETGNSSTSGVFLVKCCMPIVLRYISTSATHALRLNYVNGLYYKYNPESDVFETLGPPYPHNNSIDVFFRDSDNNWVPWNDPTAVTGLFPLSANHNIYLNDDTLFFWTLQQSINSPHLYRPQITAMMATILTVGGRTLGIALMIFGIVLGISLVKRLISWFLR